MIKIKIRRQIDKKKYAAYAIITFLVILAIWTHCIVFRGILYRDKGYLYCEYRNE